MKAGRPRRAAAGPARLTAANRLAQSQPAYPTDPRGVRPTVARPASGTGARPSRNRVSRRDPIAARSITTPARMASRSRPIPSFPIKICTGRMRVKLNIKGVPSSVNAQMKTMEPPAKIPGIISGSVTRRNLRQPVQPRFSAASSSAGSIFANAAAALR